MKEEHGEFMGYERGSGGGEEIVNEGRVGIDYSSCMGRFEGQVSVWRAIGCQELVARDFLKGST